MNRNVGPSWMEMKPELLTDPLPGAVGFLHRNDIHPVSLNDVHDTLRTNLLTIFTAAVPDVPGHRSERDRLVRPRLLDWNQT